MKAALAVALLLTLASGQSWEIEQIDTAQWGRPVLGIGRTSERGLVTLYTDPAGGRVRVAWKDSVWRHEDVSLPSTSPYVSFSTSHAARAAIAIAYSDTQGFLGVAEDSCGQWRYRPSRISMSGPVLVQDTSGREIVFGVKDGAGNWTPIVRAVNSSVWLLDTIPSGVGPDYHWELFNAIASDGNVISLLYQSFWVPAPYMSLYMGTMTDTGWARRQVSGSNPFTGMGPACAAVDTGGQGVACFYASDRYQPSRSRFWYEGTAVDSFAIDCALVIDSLNRPHIAYTTPWTTYPDLAYMYLDRTWHRFTVPAPYTSVYSRLRLALGDDGQPLIAYGNYQGIWLARGVGVVTGVEEEPVTGTRFEPSAASVVGGRAAVEWQTILRGADGRIIRDSGRGQGVNRRLPAGIYFACRQDGATRKVVVVR